MYFILVPVLLYDASVVYDVTISSMRKVPAFSVQNTEETLLFGMFEKGWFDITKKSLYERFNCTTKFIHIYILLYLNCPGMKMGCCYSVVMYNLCI